MSENAFYLMHKSSKQKKSVHKLGQEDKISITNKDSKSLNKAVFLLYLKITNNYAIKH